MSNIWWATFVFGLFLSAGMANAKAGASLMRTAAYHPAAQSTYTTLSSQQGGASNLIDV